MRGQSRRTKSGGVVTSLVDISEVKRREREAMQARAVLQSVFDNLSDGVLLYEADGRWVYQNPAMAKLHDMSDELLNTLPTFADIVHYRAQRGDYGPIEELPGGLEGWIESRVRRFISADQPPERRRTTTGRTVEVTYRRLADRRVLTIHRDLTEIVEQEERLKAARAESEKTRETLQSVLDNMIDGVMLLDRDFRCRFVNRQVNEFLQLEPEVAAPGASGLRHPALPGAARRPRPGRQRGRGRGQGRRAAGADAPAGRHALRAPHRLGPHHRVQLPADPRRRHAGDLSRHHRAQGAAGRGREGARPRRGGADPARRRAGAA